jgi:hypothetical protein
LRVLEEKLLDAVMALKCTANTIRGLMDYSEANQRLKVDIFDNQCASVGRLRPNESHTKDDAGHNTERAQLRQFLRCVELRLEKGESLLKRTKRTARLVYTSTSQIKVEIEFD